MDLGGRDFQEHLESPRFIVRYRLDVKHLRLLPFGSSWTQGSGNSVDNIHADELAKNNSAARLVLKDFFGGLWAPSYDIFLYGPAHAIYHGFRTHKGSSLFKYAVLAKWQHP